VSSLKKIGRTAPKAEAQIISSRGIPKTAISLKYTLPISGISMIFRTIPKEIF
jgi:hypothetical protein